MATYKVLQDIEAEDKLVGPLTLRQCIYAAIALLSGYLTFIVISKHVAFMAIFFLPFLVFGTFFAIPWSKQQSTEVWALAKIRFALKPRRRIWDQSGVKDLVTVTAPKKLATGPVISDLSETEVRSRLRALADTIDSRGWAVKNVNVNLNAQPYSFAPQSDRLVDSSSFPQQVSDAPTTASDDIFDFSNNPIAQQFDQKINAATNAHRQQLISTINNPAATVAAPTPSTDSQNYWYLSQPVQAASPVISSAAAPATGSTNWQVPQAATPTAEEEALAREIKRKQELFDSVQTASHWRTIQPLSAQQDQSAQSTQAAPVTAVATPTIPAATTVTDTVSPVILDLANNNDLDVATIAREAQHRNPDASGEVVVKLH